MCVLVEVRGQALGIISHQVGPGARIHVVDLGFNPPPKSHLVGIFLIVGSFCLFVVCFQDRVAQAGFVLTMKSK